MCFCNCNTLQEATGQYHLSSANTVLNTNEEERSTTRRAEEIGKRHLKKKNVKVFHRKQS